MAARWKIGIALTFLLGLSLGGLGLFLDDPEPSPLNEQDLEPSPGAERSTAEHPGPAAPEQVREVLGSTGMRLAAQVVDRLTEEAVRSFDLLLKGRDRLGRPFRTRRETIENLEGRFSLPLGGGGTYTLSIKASGYVREHILDLRIPPGKRLTSLCITLDPVHSLSGRVVDQATGLPIKGALVVAEALTRSSSYGYEEGATTDEEGRFRFVGLRRSIYRVTACHEDYEEGSIEAEPSV